MDKPIPEAVRQQFETWARPKWRHREDFDQRIGAPRGTYNNIEVQAAWGAWQALTAAQQQGQAAPPSAPVVPDWITGDGLQGIKAEAHFLSQHKDEVVQRVSARLLERAEKIITALDQATSAPVGVDAPLSVFSAGAWTYETGQVFSADDLDGAAFAVYRPHLAQQPAAVDEATIPAWRVMPFTGSWKACDERWEVYSPDGSGGVVLASEVRSRYVADLLDALATQHQEPTT